MAQEIPEKRFQYLHSRDLVPKNGWLKRYGSLWIIVFVPFRGIKVFTFRYREYMDWSINS
jgi:hypothetical protein